MRLRTPAPAGVAVPAGRGVAGVGDVPGLCAADGCVLRTARHQRIEDDPGAYVTEKTTLIRADAKALPLADQSVDLIVTSPPYWALRSYTDGGEHYDGQIGAEPTPAAYVDSLIDVTRECMRVLKPTGSIWVNLGDKYAGSDGTSGGTAIMGNRKRAGIVHRSRPATGAPRKSLIGLPWRYAIRCIDDLGLILRAEVIWSKPNGLPESVTDRVRRSHETWFHMVKQPRYFSAVDAIREQAQDRGTALSWQERKDRGDPTRYGEQRVSTDGAGLGVNPLGKLPSSVWTIATEPLTVPDHLGVDHFAAFPSEWPRRIILGWSPSGICTACGEGRRPVSAADYEPLQRTNGADKWTATDQDGRGQAVSPFGRARKHVAITGEVCACPDASAPTRPSVILDPFGGTGTTALVAEALGRRGVSVDMSADYLRIAAWRVSDPGQRAKALGVPKPPAEADGQLDLLGVMP
jgi:DNA modification methylase